MTLNINTLSSLFVKALFVIILLELFLLGSGQFFSINGISLRMLFYISAILFSSVIILEGIKIQRLVFLFLLIYISMLSFSSFIGILNGASSSQILENIKPLIFAFMILPFSLFITNFERVYLVSNLIKLSGLFMSISFVLLLIFLYLGYIDFNAMYTKLSSDANDFMMNNADIPRIFYKGFLYLCIAFIFYAYSDYKYKIFILSLLFIAILLTFTRGFLLALILSFIFISIIEFKKKKSFFILISIFIGLIIFLPFYTNIIGERDVSDSIRILQIKEVFDAITFSSFFIGHGYGIGVPIRPNGMEITFLEIFHKQGILGLFLWIGFFFYLIYKYLNIKNLAYKKIFKPFLISTFFIYFQSLTNPYLNNPIGMSMVLLAFSVLLVILNIEKKERMVQC
ncbi:hypothetical protein N5U36_09220 [Aliarcobacter butzleri]|uniref:O-antigen ligase family protein n=1 Tax=Aliarcobacter butzleri TaxID=28197 RepID=UPI0021B210EC|nr:O-antigen ligase family protein [Aliarcobacter butzleri]MCT7635633.1 hypothetical protein [Aliarcobacter butzleri]